MSIKKIKLYIDLVIYIVLIPFITLFVPSDQSLISDSYFFIALVIYVYFVYFINSYYNIIGLLWNKKYLRATIFLSIVVVATFLMTKLPIEYFSLNIKSTNMHLHESIRARVVWYIFTLLIIICFALGLFYELFRQTLNKQEIEMAKKRAEIALYKAQIDPHFMFNTLNTLYGLIIAKSEKAEGAFIKFTDMIKHVYTNAHDDDISIGKEIEYIANYIELQSMRLNHHTKIAFTHSVDDNAYILPPILLITFIENCFKYGVSAVEDTVIKIDITVKDEILKFSTCNKILHTSKERGIGIDNCRKRLELLYPNNYTLSNYEKEGNYYVELMINGKLI